MDWYANCSYELDRKRRFHATARARLKHLATALGFAPGAFEVRSNQGGVAVSGEIILHHMCVYVQICQPATREFRHSHPRVRWTQGHHRWVQSFCSTQTSRRYAGVRRACAL